MNFEKVPTLTGGDIQLLRYHEMKKFWIIQCIYSCENSFLFRGNSTISFYKSNKQLTYSYLEQLRLILARQLF